MMVSKGDSQNQVKQVTKPSNKETTLLKDQALGNVGKHEADLIRDINTDILTNEATRDTKIDEMEAEVINAHMKMLEDDSVSIDKREQILENIYARIDKRRDYEAKNRLENTKRLKSVLWMSTFKVLGKAALKYAPNILGALVTIIKIR